MFSFFFLCSSNCYHDLKNVFTLVTTQREKCAPTEIKIKINAKAKSKKYKKTYTNKTIQFHSNYKMALA